MLHTELHFHDPQPKVRYREGIAWMKVEDGTTAVVIYLTREQCLALSLIFRDAGEQFPVAPKPANEVTA